MKRILLISSAFYPIITPRSFRVTELAKELSRQGHDVTVYTVFGAADYCQLEDGFNIKLKNLGPRRFGSINFAGTGFASFFRRIVRRLLLQVLEFPDIELMYLVQRVLKRERDYDLLITFAVPFPVHWGAAWARSEKKRIAKIWVADCGDPYVGCQTDSFKKLFYFSYVEKWFCRKANYLSIPVQSATVAYFREFHHKIRIIPQGFEFKYLPDPETPIRDGKVKFAYAGAFIRGIRDPRPFLEFLTKIEKDFLFTIYTENTEILADFVETLGDRLVVKRYVPRDQLLILLKANDFLVNFDNNTTVQSPSKLIDYMLVGRPVLNVARVIEPDVILEFLEKKYTQQLSLININQYNIVNVARQFIDLI